MEQDRTPGAVLDADTLAYRRARYQPIAGILSETYGYPTWRPHHPPVDELVSTILSQNTSDVNCDRAFQSLKARFPDWESVRDAPVEDVADAIRSAGLSRQKAPRIQAALRRITEERGAITLDFLAELPLDDAKAWLTSLNGIGPKTAAIVLLFAFGRPAFPVDTHVHRVTKRLGLINARTTADQAHAVLEAIVPPDDYYAFHLNVIRHGRQICKAPRPLCERCPLTAHCDYYRALTMTGG